MGMTPADQGPPDAKPPSGRSPSHPEAQPRSGEDPGVPHARSGTGAEAAGSSPNPDAAQHPRRQPGDDERDQVDTDAAPSSPPQDRPLSSGSQHGPGESDQTRGDGAELRHHETRPSNHDRQGQDEGEIGGDGAMVPAAQTGPAARPENPASVAPDASAHDSVPAAPAGQAPGGPARAPGSGVSAGASDGDASQTTPHVASDDRVSSAPPTQRDSEPVGWFSTGADPAQVTKALSERLSAERPIDEPVDGPTAEEHASPGSAGDPAATPQPIGHQNEPTRSASPPGASQAEESYGVGLSQSTESTSQASGDAAAMPGGEAPRSPELIEAGMVYVDPDPETGSPPSAPRAAGWGEQNTAPLSPTSSAASQAQPTDARSTDIQQTHGAGSPSLAGVTPVPTGPTHELAIPAVVPQGQYDAGAPDHQRQHGSDDQRPSGTNNSPQAGGAQDAIGSIADEAPWTKPSLPMGDLPADSPSASREGGPRQTDEEAPDEPSIQRPDPSWPRLFEQRQDVPQLKAEEASNSQLPSEDRLTPGTGTGPSKPADAVAAIPEPMDGAARSMGEETAAHSPSASEKEPGGSTGIVDLTNAEVPSAAEAAMELEHARQPVADSGLQSLASGAGTQEQANISTVAQIADAAEVDLRDPPVGSPVEDVSRETSAGGGEGMDPAHDEEAVEDEAAVAVREAVSRAAAEAGVDVSRETEFIDASSNDGLVGEPTIDSESAARAARVSFRIYRESLNGTRRVVAVANQKGGVGKSTTAVNIGAYLALAGARVLVIDLDPQGNASTGLGLDHRDIEPSIYDVLTGDAPATAAIRATGVANLQVLPSTIDLAGAEVELVSAMSRETRLRRALESIDHQYDTILIDCPPSLGLLTVNALAAADELLIPIQCEYYALEGLGQLLRNVELVRANLNPELRIGGIVLTMYDGRTRLALQVVDEVRKHFTDLVYQTVVPRSVRLSEAPGYGLPIALYDPLSRGGIAYRDLTFELAERSGLLAPTGEGAS
jgi:chromosome partitioning protein